MSRTWAFRWLTCWAAIFAVLFTALAPTLGHAATKLGATEQYIAVCTSTGMKYIKASALGDAEPADVKQQTESTDCSYCQGSTHSAIPASLQASRFDVPEHATLHLQSLVQPTPLHVGWRLPPPRAPPASV
jgi:hypothetical protein